MKKLVLSSVLVLSMTFGFAQNKDVLEETVTKTKTVVDNQGAEKVSKSMVVRQEQAVELSQEDQNKINQSRVDSSMKVTTHQIVVEGDSKVMLDKKATFICNGSECDFTPQDDGFTIASLDDAELNATTYVSSNKNFIVETEKGNGVGYFDKDGNFVLEYYDKSTNELIKRIYTSKTK
ncbi:hypothetical protein [Galbibacter sp.]|uniref:hypothetical protein n=1 Tax=Galbibacter sp. TaxID=2918471 RepID=UPI003A902738